MKADRLGRNSRREKTDVASKSRNRRERTCHSTVGLPCNLHMQSDGDRLLVLLGMGAKSSSVSASLCICPGPWQDGVGPRLVPVSSRKKDVPCPWRCASSTVGCCGGAPEGRCIQARQCAPAPTPKPISILNAVLSLEPGEVQRTVTNVRWVRPSSSG